MRNTLIHMVYILVIAFLVGVIRQQPEVVSNVSSVVDTSSKRCIVSKYQPGTFESASKRTD